MIEHQMHTFGSNVEGQGNAFDLATTIKHSCASILEEVEVFENFLKTNASQIDPAGVHLTNLKKDVKAELERVVKLGESDPTFESHMNLLIPSNYPFEEACWAVAKNCSRVTAVKQLFSIKGLAEFDRRGNKHIKVDVIADNGAEWVKISTITEKRIGWDLIKAGYDGALSSDDESEEEEADDGPSRMMELPLYRQMKLLVKISHNRDIQIPQIRLVFTRIDEEHCTSHCSELFREIRKLGINVQTVADLPPILPISDMVQTMAPVHKLALAAVQSTETLNLDCTLLVSICSDITWGGVDPQEWHSESVRQQIQIEADDPLLQNWIWPIVRKRRLICTRVAYDKLIEVVSTIGTETEKKRAELIFPARGPGGCNLSSHERTKHLHELSNYDFTMEMVLPIEIIDVDRDLLMTHLPPLAVQIAEDLSHLSPTTLETLLYGWASGSMTLSSNKDALNRIQHLIMKYRGDDTHIVGPDVRTFSPARNLVGDFYVADRSIIPESWKKPRATPRRVSKSVDTEMAGA